MAGHSSSVEVVVITLAPVVILLLVYGPYLVHRDIYPLTGYHWQPEYAAATRVETRNVTQEIDICSFEIRRSLVRKTCEKYGKRNIYRRRGHQLSIMGSGFINTDQQIFYCKISKAGIPSVRKYFNHLNKHRKLPIFTEYADFRKALAAKDGRRVAESYALVGSIPLSDFMASYGSAKKILVVRHPLQRVASIYDQLAEEEKGLNNFTQFIEQKVLNKDLFSFHAFDYQESCHPCSLDYDYIVKQETFDTEMQIIDAEMDTESRGMYSQNKTTAPILEAAAYEYDRFLAEFQQTNPWLFSRLYNRYSVDMEMFGYTWSWGKSGCGPQVNGCC